MKSEGLSFILNLQFQLILTTLKFWPYVALSKTFGAFVSGHFSRFFKSSFAWCFLMPIDLLCGCRSLLAQNFDFFGLPYSLLTMITLYPNISTQFKQWHNWILQKSKKHALHSIRSLKNISTPFHSIQHDYRLMWLGTKLAGNILITS